MKARNYIPALKFGARLYPEDFASPLTFTGKYKYVDGDNGADSNRSGESIEKPYASLEYAVNNADAWDVIFVKNLNMGTGATDPANYTENAVIAAPDEGVQIIGVGNGRCHGGLPHIKVGSTTTQALLTIRSPGCRIANIAFNGAGATGGGILLDDDGSTKTAFGTTIENCYFRNCKGSTATSAATGGAIQLSGAPWWLLISGNRFYDCVGGIVLKDTSNSAPKDIVIENNSFGGSAAAVDCDIYGAGGSGFAVGLTIRGNDFNVFPALSSGATLLWMDLTGADGGVVAGNYFADDKTFGAAGTGAKVPTTVLLSGNYDEGGLIARA